MIKAGLFERRRCRLWHAQHHWLGEGKFYFHPGEMMAAVDNDLLQVIYRIDTRTAAKGNILLGAISRRAAVGRTPR